MIHRNGAQPRCGEIGVRRQRDRMAEMTGWILLGLVAWLVGVAFVFVLCQMSGKEDRAAHCAERTLPSFSHGTIAKTAH